MLQTGAVAIAEAVRAGRCRAAEVLGCFRARHEQTHERLNALVQPRLAEAAAEAAAIDADPTGPLAGVPVSVKECFPVRGLRTTLGIPARAGLVDQTDAAIVSRLRELGGIIVGKANSDPYLQYASAIDVLARHTGLKLDRRNCYPYRR